MESQQSLLGQQLEHDTRMRVIDRMHELMVQGGKGLSILNGGAVVAMLAFVQALMEKQAYGAFKPFALAALSCFLIGAFLAAVAFFFHHTYVNHAFNDSGRQKLWRRVVWGILIVSASCAFVGGGVVTAGICVAT